ncbi:Imm51 family immunity protein [Dactylosporangium sp. CA-092794]|uniref:Imm51 family immunity protein n=1 Tax=Dactylosporangium sp. CA-092794 TaxID=3239929 RepID=UPI003D8A7AF4
MDPIRLVETTPGKHSLILVAGSTGVDDTIAELGHEPNGYFWEGIAQLLIDTEAPQLDGRFEFDSEAGTFVADGPDRPALAALSDLMRTAATDPSRMRALVAYADESGFEFDD